MMVEGLSGNLVIYIRSNLSLLLPQNAIVCNTARRYGYRALMITSHTDDEEYKCR